MKKHVQRYLNGQNPESLEHRIIFMSMFNDMEWTDRQYRNLFVQGQRSGSICVPIQARTPVLLGARVGKHVVERKSQRTSMKMRYCRTADGSHVQLSHFTPNMSSDKTMIVWTISKVHSKSTKFLISTTLTGTLSFIYNRTRHWYETKICVINQGKTVFQMPQARGRLVATTHKKSRDADSQSCRTSSIARTMENGQINITNESVMDGSTSIVLCRDYHGDQNVYQPDYIYIFVWQYNRESGRPTKSISLQHYFLQYLCFFLHKR